MYRCPSEPVACGRRFAGRLTQVMRQLPALLAALALLSGPARAAELKIGGTGSGTALLRALAIEYAATHPGAHIEVVPFSLGSGGGARALAADKIDLAILGRPLKPDEQQEGFRVVAWARTPLVLATSGGHIEGGLDVPLLAGMLRNQRTTWDDGSRIRLVMRIPQESDTIILSGYSPELKRALDACLSSPTAVVADTDIDAVGLLSQTPGSLGTTTLGLIALQGSRLTPLAFAGVKPSLQTMADGAYPLAKELYLLFREKPRPPLAQFLEWLVSPAVAARLPEFQHQPLFP